MHQKERGFVRGPVRACRMKQGAEYLCFAPRKSCKLSGVLPAQSSRHESRREGRCCRCPFLLGNGLRAVEAAVEFFLVGCARWVIGRKKQRERVLAEAADFVHHGVREQDDLTGLGRLNGRPGPLDQLFLCRLYEQGHLSPKFCEQFSRARVIVGALVVRERAPRANAQDGRDARLFAEYVGPFDVGSFVPIVFVHRVETKPIGANAPVCGAGGFRENRVHDGRIERVIVCRRCVRVPHTASDAREAFVRLGVDVGPLIRHRDSVRRFDPCVPVPNHLLSGTVDGDARVNDQGFEFTAFEQCNRFLDAFRPVYRRLLMVVRVPGGFFAALGRRCLGHDLTQFKLI